MRRPSPRPKIKHKPLDRWLAVAGLVVGIVLFLLPKSPFLVVSLLVVVFFLLLHPVWNFWWIEKSGGRRAFALTVLAAGLVWLGGYVLPEATRAPREITEISQAKLDAAIAAARDAPPPKENETQAPSPAPRPPTSPAVPLPRETSNADPNREIDPETVTLYDLFKRDFAATSTGEKVFKHLIPTARLGVKITGAVVADFGRGSRLIEVYVPASRQTFAILADISGSLDRLLESSDQIAEVVFGIEGEPTPISGKDLPFSKTVYLYTESRLSQNEILALTQTYARKGLRVHFRGPPYLAERKAIASARKD